MAINKNFVVKNGLEVNQKLILADSVRGKVGIGTSLPGYLLDVAGGIGVTDIYVSGTVYTVGVTTIVGRLNVGTNGSTLTGVGGSVGVGTSSPQYLLDIRSPVSTGQTALYVQGDSKVTGNLDISGNATLSALTLSNITVNNQATTQNLTVTGFNTSGYLNVTGIATIATLGVSGLTTTQNLNVTGITTIATLGVSGLTTTQNLNVTGLTTTQNLNVTGVATIATLQNLNSTGIATIATLGVSGLTTTQNLNVTGITTLGITSATNLISQNLNVSGITTLSQLYVSGITTLSQLYVSGISTLGITTLSQLYVSGISTFQSTTLIGGGTSTGTAGQVFQVSGINSSVYIGGNLGIGTTNPTSALYLVGNTLITGISTFDGVKISSGIVTATTGIVTYYGDGSKLSNVLASISTNTTNQSQYLTYVTGTGSTTGFGITTTGLVFNPSSGNLGLGTASPAFKADIAGDARITSTNKMRFGGTAGTTNFYIQYNSTTNSLDFVAG